MSRLTRRSIASSLLFLSFVAAGCGSGSAPYTADEVRTSFARDGIALFPSLLGYYFEGAGAPTLSRDLLTPDAVLSTGVISAPPTLAFVYGSEADAIQSDIAFRLLIADEYVLKVIAPVWTFAEFGTERRRNVLVVYPRFEGSERRMRTALAQLP